MSSSPVKKKSPNGTKSPNRPPVVTVHDLEEELAKNAKVRRKFSWTDLLSMMHREVDLLKVDIQSVIAAPVNNGQAVVNKILKKQSSALKRLLTEVYRYRQYGTLAALVAFNRYLGTICTLVVVLLQLTLVASAHWRFWSQVGFVILWKIQVTLLRLLRKVLQVPFDIPANIIKIARRKSLALTDAERDELLKAAQRELKKVM